MADLDRITSCLDVTDDDIRTALAAVRSFSEASPRDKTLALLGRMVEVARPASGAPRILVLLARMAKRDWLEGDLVVRLIGDTELSVLELLVDDGASRERMAGPLRLDVPMHEFASALERSPKHFMPLVALELSPRRIELRGTRDQHTEQRKGSISAFAVELKTGLSESARGQTTEAPKKQPPPLPPRRPR
ncbi:MAG: hypothetical protein KF718_15130 [Polyangiaceae bacterium]|nr:hypothetical protein [Polyangiaceae bacterium]